MNQENSKNSEIKYDRDSIKEGKKKMTLIAFYLKIRVDQLMKIF